MDTRQAAGMLAALAQETRLDLLRLLFARGASGMAAGDIAGRLQVPASTLSFHLAAMEREGLLQSTRQGRRIVYAVRLHGMRDLLGFLTETCCGGRPDLCGDLARLLPDTEETPAMVPAFNVLFLCTANSARSIMAEAILGTIGAGRFNAYSAGSAPAPHPQPRVIEKLAALGHHTAGLHSKSWDEFMRPDAPRMDFVIALCDMLDGQVCPDFGERAVTGSWPLPDPAKFTGSAVEREALLNELYAALDRRLRIFISLPFASLDRIAVRKRLDEIGGAVRA
jgi:arsenate reductase